MLGLRINLLSRPLVDGPELGHVLLDELLRLGAHRVGDHQLVHAAAVLQLLQHHEVRQLQGGDGLTKQTWRGMEDTAFGQVARMPAYAGRVGQL